MFCNPHVVEWMAKEKQHGQPLLTALRRRHRVQGWSNVWYLFSEIIIKHFQLWSRIVGSGNTNFSHSTAGIEKPLGGGVINSLDLKIWCFDLVDAFCNISLRGINKSRCGWWVQSSTKHAQLVDKYISDLRIPRCTFVLAHQTSRQWSVVIYWFKSSSSTEGGWRSSIRSCALNTSISTLRNEGLKTGTDDRNLQWSSISTQ